MLVAGQWVEGDDAGLAGGMQPEASTVFCLSIEIGEHEADCSGGFHFRIFSLVWLL